MNAVDTNVFVYSLDPDEPVKQAKAIELLDRLVQPPSVTLLLWQVAAGLLAQLRRWQSQGRLTSPEVEASFRRTRAMFAMRMPTDALLQMSFV